MDFKTTIGSLRVIGFIEGLSYIILLGIAMPLKYIFHWPLAVKIMGTVHGFLFVAFIVYSILAWKEYKWNFKTLIIVLISSIIPFGTFWADKKYFIPTQNNQ